FNGAEPVRHDTMERFTRTFGPCGFRHEAFYPCYGLAEATLFVTGGAKVAAPVVRTVDARALENNQVNVTDEGKVVVGDGHWPDGQVVRIVHPESGIPCAPGQVGEIWVQGPSVARGYWNRTEENERVFNARLEGTDEGAFLRTGDLGFLLDGELFVTG